MNEQKYTRRNYEVQTSKDGQQWFLNNHHTFPQTPEGEKAARALIVELRRGPRQVRLAKSTREVEVLEVYDNNPYRQQQDLLSRAKVAVEGILGIQVHEGFDLDMGTLQASPTRISVSFRTTDVLGKYPAPPTASDTNARREEKRQARLKWNEDAERIMQKALDESEAKLTAAGIKFQRCGQAIHLKP